MWKRGAVPTLVVGSLILWMAISCSTPPSLPESLPTITPKPTVIGTPISGADIAAGGNIGFTLIAHGISLVVDNVKAYKNTLHGRPNYPGYVFVVVSVRYANASPRYFTTSDFKLIDDFDNKYENWSIAEEFDSIAMSGVIEPGMSGGGNLVYNVPEAALANSLRLRLEPVLYEFDQPSVRMEVFFTGTLNIETQ